MKEAGAQRSRPPITPVVGQGPEAAADWANLKSPETYTGYARTERFASPGGIVRSERHVYTAPERLRDNQWALDGDWTMEREVGALERRQRARAISASTRATCTW